MNNSISSKISDYHSLELQSHVSIDDAIVKVSEELYELEHAIHAHDINEIKKEAQDVLINILSISARFFDIGSVLEGVLIKENVHI